MKIASLHSADKRAADAEAEQQRLNVLANRELLIQELSGLAGAREWMNEPLEVGNRKLANFLLPTEDWEDMPDVKVSWILSNLRWVKFAIKNKIHNIKTK